MPGLKFIVTVTNTVRVVEVGVTEAEIPAVIQEVVLITNADSEEPEPVFVADTPMRLICAVSVLLLHIVYAVPYTSLVCTE